MLIQKATKTARALRRRILATTRNLTGTNVAIIAVGSYLVAIAFALLAGIASGIYGSSSDTPAKVAGGVGVIIAAIFLILWVGGNEADREDHEAAELQQPDSQAARMAHAQSLLQEAGSRIAQTLTETTATIQQALDSTTGIADALQMELNDSRATIDRLIAETHAIERKAAQARARAAVGLDSAKAIDEQLDYRLKERLAEQETKGRRWDLKITAWNLGLGVFLGILTTIITTHVFHF